MLITAAGSVLLLVDLQQRLLPAIDDGDAVLAAAVRLATAAQLLDVPVCATEQNPAGLGPTVEPLAAFPQLVLTKTAFGATADPGFGTLLPPGTEEIVQILERVLARSPNHPGAIHLYIHAVEAGREPARAEAPADRLARLMPGAGHIVHMPSHIYWRVGRYADAVRTNAAAVEADRAYFKTAQPSAIYRGLYLAGRVSGRFSVVSERGHARRRARGTKRGG